MGLEIELDEMFTDEITESVVYSRGDDEVSLCAIPEEGRFEALQPNGVIVEVRTVDFLVKSKDLDFGSGPTEPNRKDTITRTRGGITSTFEVLPDPAFTHFEEVDTYGFCYRIRTKKKPST